MRILAKGQQLKPKVLLVPRPPPCFLLLSHGALLAMGQ